MSLFLTYLPTAGRPEAGHELACGRQARTAVKPKDFKFIGAVENLYQFHF